MKIFWFIIIIIFAIWLIYYISTLPQRRKNEELIVLLEKGIQEKINMERKKDKLRGEKDITKKEIEEIVKMESAYKSTLSQAESALERKDYYMAYSYYSACLVYARKIGEDTKYLEEKIKMCEIHL